MSNVVEEHPTSVEEVADRLVGILNGACVALMLSVGHRTGLFGVMADGTARTSAELADAAGLQERYVRE